MARAIERRGAAPRALRNWPGIATLAAAIGRASAIRRSRAALADLNDHLLCDIGVTRAEARREADRPFWDMTQG